MFQGTYEQLVILHQHLKHTFDDKKYWGELYKS